MPFALADSVDLRSLILPYDDRDFVALEVKNAVRLDSRDFDGLKAFQSDYPEPAGDRTCWGQAPREGRLTGELRRMVLITVE